jgi:hypothetical protein
VTRRARPAADASRFPDLNAPVRPSSENTVDWVDETPRGKPRGIADRNPQELRGKPRGIHHPAKAG